MRGTAGAYARYVLAVMVGINFLNYMDRWVASAAATPIQKEFQLTDAQFGLIGTAFLLIYALAAVPFGVWGDRGVRKTVIGVGVTIWSLATLFTGFARSYFQLFLSRAIVGVGEASYYPAGTSLMSDFFPKEQRSRVMSIWNAGSAVGIAVGFAGGGFIAEKFGWRTAFYFAAIPGLLFATLAFAFKEPLRGSTEKGNAVERTNEIGVQTFLQLITIPTLRATILAQTLLFFVLASNAFWLPSLLQRRFQMTQGKAGLLAGVVIVAGGLIGTLLGGWLADQGAKRRPEAPLEVGIAGFVGGAVLITLALLSPMNVGPIPVFIPVFLATVVCLYLYTGPFTAVSQNVVSPGLRASAVTLTLLVAHVLGDSHSTFDVGKISDLLHGNLQAALLITSPTLLLLAALAAATGLKTIRHDTEEMEQIWASKTEPEPVFSR